MNLFHFRKVVSAAVARLTSLECCVKAESTTAPPIHAIIMDNVLIKLPLIHASVKPLLRVLSAKVE